MKFSLTRPFISYSETLPDADRYYVRKNTSKPFNFSTERFEKPIKESFDQYQSTPQTEYLFRYQDHAFIEPIQGWAITDMDQLIYESIPFSESRKINFPSFWRTSYLKRRGERVHLPSAVSIRYSWQNYFHFFNDGMGQLYMLDELGISNDVPVIIPDFVRSSKFGKYLVNNHPAFKRRKILFQNLNQLIVSNDLIFVKNIPNVTSHFVKIANDITGGPVARRKFPEKVFLTRRSTYYRSISNAEELHPKLQQAGYTIIDTADLDVPDQINLFRNLTHLVAPHGAGLTNIMFSRKDLHILEVFPSNSIPPHFFWMASGFGQDYNAVTHGADDGKGFNIDAGKLIDQMRSLDFI